MKPNREKQVWLLRREDAVDKPVTCSINCDQGEIHVDRAVASGEFFVLTMEAGAEFRAALDEALKGFNDLGRKWQVLCCDGEGDLALCSIETRQEILLVACGGTTGEPWWEFELYGTMIDEFSCAIDEALQAARTYVAKRGEDPNSQDAEPVELWSPGKEIPELFALCEGIPPIGIALGVCVDDRVKIVSSRRDEGAIFRSAELARRSLSTNNNVQLVWLDQQREAQPG